MYILLPLASNIKVKNFKYGEYIVRAGEVPEGLIIISKGSCIVCAEKLAMRSKKTSKFSKANREVANFKTNPTGSSMM